jgi:hypothetical protein
MLSRDTPATRGIEALCEVGGQRYAIEHTLIEPFPNNQYDDIQLGRVFNLAFEEELADLVQQEYAYTITVDVYAFAGFGVKQLTAVRAALLAWVRANMHRLPEPPPGPQEVRIQAVPPDVPVRVVLGKYRTKLPGGKVRAGRYAPLDLDARRRERLLQALVDKGPKLHAAANGDAKTLLIVENRDLAITNEHLVGDTINELSIQVPYPPGEVYMVDAFGDTFYLAQLRRDGKPCLLMGDRHGDWQFATAELNPI